MGLVDLAEVRLAPADQAARVADSAGAVGSAAVAALAAQGGREVAAAPGAVDQGAGVQAACAAGLAGPVGPDPASAIVSVRGGRTFAA